MKVTDTTRLAFINPGSQQGLGTIALTLHDVVFEVDDAIGGTNSAVIQSLPAEPLPGTFFRLQMEGCLFRVAPDMGHVSARSGLEGWIDSCIFEGGQRVLFNIPTADSGHFPGQPANDFSVGFRISDCEFRELTYTGGSDTYHLQVAGRDWSVSNCTFGEAGAFGATESGHIYSNLQDSRIVGCTFIGGGAFHLFFKGSERTQPSTTVVNGNGWGNVIVGCSFEGSSSVPSFAQIFMNVKEQRFLDCTFRSYTAYAISANQQAQSSDNLLIDGCSFSSDASSSAIRFLNGGQNIRILNSTFADITGLGNARQGLIVFEAFPAVQSDRWEDLRIEGCTFTNCEYPALYFYASGRAYTVARMRFLKNVLRLPTGGAFLGSGSATIEDLVLADNFIDVDGDFAWRTMPSDCVARSTNNVWVDNGGFFPPDDDARGIRTGTRLSVQTLLTGGATVAVSDDTRAVRVAGNAGAVMVGLDDGHFDGQELVLIGASDVEPVTFQDVANLDLAANRTLGLRDTLRLIWDASTATWAELDFSDN
ncbi:MAG: hypothetical protein RL885_29555 [Planctomycetota bacterium]